MKLISSTFSNKTTELSTEESLPSSNRSGVIARQAVFGVIAVLSFLGNLLFCVVLLRKKCLLKKPYNILLLVLAVTDMLTGAVVIITPGFIVPLKTFPYPTGTAALLFCHLIDTSFLIFMLGKASVLLVMCLAIERWFASVKPLQYRIRFTSKRLGVYIISIWISTCVFQLYRLFRKIPGEDGCQWAKDPFGPRSHKALIISYVSVTFILPNIITWASFLHIWLSVKESPALNTASGNQARCRLLRMSVLTALFLTLCWFPDQLNYVLSLFDVTSLESPISDYFLVLALSNSWVNPWIYCFTNKAFRNEFRSLFTFKVFSRSGICPPKSASCLKEMKGKTDFKMTFGNPVELSQYKLYI